MPKSYSGDLRERVIEAVEMGRIAARGGRTFRGECEFGGQVAAALARERSAAPKPRGGSVSPLEKRAARVLAVIAEQPDLTLVETVAELRKRRIRTSRSALSRFFDRHGITLKKKPASRGTAASRRGPRAPTLDPRARHA